MKIFHQFHNSQSNYNYNIYTYGNANYAPHFHKNYEIAYVLSGKALYSVNGKQQVLSEGDFAFCLSNEIHSVKNLDHSKLWIGVFSEDFVHEFKKRIGERTGKDFRFRCGESVRRFLLENLITDTPDDIMMIKSCLYALCSEYLKRVELVPKDDRSGSLMLEIAEYIEANFKKPLTLKEIAVYLGYDYCYLSKAFNRFFSTSFSDYLNLFRIDNAISLLTHTSLTVTEIAFESGFQSIRNFNCVFKKHTGLSPIEFRKTERKGN